LGYIYMIQFLGNFIYVSKLHLYEKKWVAE
jgi:hypothetical protein